METIIKYLSIPEEYTNSRFEVKKVYGSTSTLTYISALEHSGDPTHPQYEMIESEWKKLHAVTHVLTEIKNMSVATTKEKAIDEALEGGFMQFLAHKTDPKIACTPIDMTRDERINSLMALGESPTDILAFEVTRKIASFEKMGSEEITEDIVNEFFIDKSKTFRKYTIPSTLDGLKRIYPELRNPLLITYDWMSPLEHRVIGGLKEVVNRISRKLTDLRDAHMVRRILSFNKDGNNVVVLAAHYHQWRQMPAIEKFWK